MNLPNILAILVLVIGLPLNVAVALLLYRRSRAFPNIRVLRERFIVELGVLILVVVFGLIFLNNDTLPPPLDTDITKIVTRAVLLIVAVFPACYWLVLYWRSPKR